MPSSPPVSRAGNSFSVRIGRWVEASATGWGIAGVLALAVLAVAVLTWVI